MTAGKYTFGLKKNLNTIQDNKFPNTNAPITREATTPNIFSKQILNYRIYLKYFQFKNNLVKSINSITQRFMSDQINIYFLFII